MLVVQVICAFTRPPYHINFSAFQKITIVSHLYLHYLHFFSLKEL